ncbi:hypothetical protein CK203_095473 [Vitis vinifera]|uniref:Uncharacterized protein n=1 Tax=Vitis vinifera TaxID=29760 RepID=A0A438EIV2_VITVI|nr:hypothetical protein CK203_095473 [Vitis vinifera]
MGLKEEGGVRVGLGRAMGSDFGRKSARKVCYWLNNVSFSVGDGRRRVSKDAWVADYWDPMGEVGGWTPLFLRPFNDWEVEEAERLLSSIQGKRVDADGEDRMLWRGTKNEIFTVKSLYKSLDHSYAVSFPG